MSVRAFGLICSAGAVCGLLGCATAASPRGATLQRYEQRALAQEHNEHGLEAIAQGRFDLAEQELRRAVAADPFHGPAHCNLGVVLLQRGKFYEAGWELRHACQLMPKAAAPRANLGLLYEAVGRYGLAEEELRGALTLAPEDVEIIGSLARVHVRQGKHTTETVA